MLVSKKAVAAVDPLGPSGGVEHLQVVARFGIAVSEYIASGSFLEHPGLGSIAPAPEVGSNARCANMHIYGKRGRRRAPREPALLMANLGQCQRESAELFGYRREQILGLAQLVEIFEEKPVLSIVSGSSLGTTLQQFVRQHRIALRNRHHRLPAEGYPWLTPIRTISSYTQPKSAVRLVKRLGPEPRSRPPCKRRALEHRRRVPC